MTHADGPGILRFDTASLPPGERFERYRALYSDGADVVQTGPEFAARITGWRLDGVGIFERALHHVGHIRDRGRAGDDGFDHLVLTLVQDGIVEYDLGDGYFPVPPGSGMVANMLRPGRNRMTNARILTVRIVRERFPVTVDDATLHGRILSPRHVGLLIEYVEALTRRIDGLTPGGAGHAAEALFALVTGALGLDQADGDTPTMRRETARIARVHALMDAALDDPALTPRMIVERSGLSRATLYRLFKSGGGLAARITERRLERLQAMLIDGTEHRSFADLAIACGFRSEAHASRLFLLRFGVRPGQYRREWIGQSEPGIPLRTMRYLDGLMK